jgi:hypothetical protein
MGYVAEDGPGWAPALVERLVWIQEGGERGSWHLGLATDAVGDEGVLEDGRRWRSARKDFT